MKDHGHSDTTNGNLQAAADRLLLQVYAPAAVVLNRDADIVYISGRTGKYLGTSGWQGQLERSRHGPRGAEGAAGLGDQKGGVRIRSGQRAWAGRSHRRQLATGESDRAGLERASQPARPDYRGVSRRGRRPPRRRNPASKRNRKTRKADDQSHLDEVQGLREEARRYREEAEAAQEELQSTNEELQSTNEELTTSKEELQSMNEELQTINSEMQTRLDDLLLAQSDMQNVLNSIENRNPVPGSGSECASLH